MMPRLFHCFVLVLMAIPVHLVVAEVSLLRPVHTYSIVARDAVSGDLGVAVQSHWFAVGTVVPWAEAGVGAVATQSFVEVSYGPLGLALLRAGKTPEQALSALLSTDEHQAVRQVAMIDRHGKVAVHTGKNCIAEASHRTGEGYSVQANLMGPSTVPDAMATAFESSSGPLAERLLVALKAAQAQGGDIRGKQSAAILVVRSESTGKPWEDRLVDLHVEDHNEPLEEMTRLLRLHRAYEHMNAGDVAMETQDFAAARREYGAAQELAPDNAEMLFWHGITLVGAGFVDDAEPLLARAYGYDDNWRTLVSRLPAAGLLQDDEKLLKRLTTLEAIAPE